MCNKYLTSQNAANCPSMPSKRPASLYHQTREQQQLKLLSQGTHCFSLREKGVRGKVFLRPKLFFERKIVDFTFKK